MTSAAHRGGDTVGGARLGERINSSLVAIM